MLLLTRVEYGETQLLEMIFQGNSREVLSYQKQIASVKEVFKNSCRYIIGEQHNDDWEMLEQGLVATLKDHFVFWDWQFKQIFQYAIDSIIELSQGQKLQKEAYKEMLNNLMLLSPRDNTRILEMRNSEHILVRLAELKDAFHMRKMKNKEKHTIVKTALLSRKTTIQKRENCLNYNLAKELDFLKQRIQDGISKTIARRRDVFSRLWVKFLKVAREISRVQHLENNKLKKLESK